MPLSGALNSLLLELSRNDLFTKAWDIPPKTPDEKDQIPKELADNSLYEKMGDAEIVLRFFALRHVDRFANGMHGFLDRYMIRSRDFADDDIETLKSLFLDTLQLAADIYGDQVFRPYDPTEPNKRGGPQRAFYDAVMVGLSMHLQDRDRLLNLKERVQDATKQLFLTHELGTFTGRGNTKSDIQQRINLFGRMLAEVLAS